jgi:hypothetical protein
LLGSVIGLGVMSGAVPAWSDEIFLGAGPTPAGCAAAVAGQQGAVCGQSFALNGTAVSGALTFLAFSGLPGVTSSEFLTFKIRTALPARGRARSSPGNGR